jgi:hypothetical protein
MCHGKSSVAHFIYHVSLSLGEPTAKLMEARIKVIETAAI